MTFLPIVGRELRVASRRRSTWWGRLGAGALALLFFFALQLLGGLGGALGVSPGQFYFNILKWLVFIIACSAGVFLISDSLSEEKREGTLGLLFLTDLRGYDVVIGKLVSHSLLAFYALLAAFPVLGLTLLLGGVTGAEFGRVLLVICNTLFFCLALGLFVSSLSRDSTKAMNAALFLSLFFLAGLPLLDQLLSRVLGGTSFLTVLSIASPGYLFEETGAYLQGDFWQCLAVQHALAWAFLVLSSVRLPRTWQEKSSGAPVSRLTPGRRWRFGGSRFRLEFRRRLLDRDPVLWLALRDRWLPRLVGAFILVILLACGWYLFDAYLEYLSSSSRYSFSIAFFRLPWMQVALGFWVVMQAGRFFVEARRSGAMELILVTPVTPAELVRGQWSALWRTYRIPALVVLCLIVAEGLLNILQFLKLYANTGNAPIGQIMGFYVSDLIANVLTFIGGLAALGWFGMWMGLTSRKNSTAMMKTIIFAGVLPWVLLYIFQYVLLFLLMRGGFQTYWMGSAVICGLFLAKDFFFIIWSRRRLRTRFREAVLDEGGASRFRWWVLPPFLRSLRMSVAPVPGPGDDVKS